MNPDVVVVGAGVIGSAVAFHAAERKMGTVEVIDRSGAGSGMSCRSSALVRSHYAFPPEIQLALRSRAMFDSWPDLVGRPSIIRETGWLKIVPAQDVPNLRKNVEIQHGLGATVELVGPDELSQLAPELRTDDIELAAWEEHGGYGDGATVAGDLLAAARSRGVGYRAKTPVLRLVREGDRITGVETPDGVTSAGVVVLAAGVWAPPLLHQAGIEVPLHLESSRVAIVRHVLGEGASLACTDVITGTYFRPESGGYSTVIGGHHDSGEVSDPDSLPASADPEQLAHVVAAASNRAPRLLDAGIAAGTTGVYDMTPDTRPLLGALPGISGMLLAVGFSGMGFKISPAVGESVAALIDGRQDGAVDISPFRPGRFEEGMPIRPEFPYASEEPGPILGAAVEA
ncbi:MAG: FAD-binding oxidoreductase [Actinomycetota bacterium]|nr:FAD-binding oxidoreductase [Actinomycetota bacterium]